MRYERNDPFLECAEWRVMRMRALERDGAKCACCGRTAQDGITINVDHIKPRARFPELALTLDNLQVLCDECNHGKGNKFETDWRRTPSRLRPTRSSTGLALLQMTLMHPGLALSQEPLPPDGTEIGDALSALTLYICAVNEESLTTARVMQSFAGNKHEKTFAAALAQAEESGINPSNILEPEADQLRQDAAARYSQRKLISPEAERLRQLEAIRKGAAK